MTKLFERGIKAVETLPPERQDIAGTLLLELARKAAPEFALTLAQLEDLKAAVDEADRGEFASEAEVAEAWRKFSR
jgi:hypothetical protein